MDVDKDAIRVETKTGTIPDYEAYLADRRKGANAIIGLIGFLGTLSIIAATIIWTTAINQGLLG